MKKDELLKIAGMTDEMATAVIEAYKDYLPKSRFDEVNEAKKTAENMIAERDKQIADLKKSEGATEELRKQIEALQAENAKGVEMLKQTKIDNAIALALKDAGAKNIKTILPLLTDLTELDDGGMVKGLDKQIKALQESEETAFLFNSKTENKLAGMTPQTSNKQAGAGITRDQFIKMGYKERNDLFNTNRELYNSLAKED